MTDNNLHGSKLQNDRADAEAAARSGAQIADVVRQGATAMQQTGHVTNEAIRRGAEATAEITRQGTQAGVEASRRASETAERDRASEHAGGGRGPAPDCSGRNPQVSGG